MTEPEPMTDACLTPDERETLAYVAKQHEDCCGCPVEDVIAIARRLANRLDRAEAAGAWRPPENVPEVPAGELGMFIVALRGSSGRVHVGQYAYLNAYPLILGDDHPEMTEEGFVPCTGWHELTYHPEFDECYVRLGSDREVVGWQPLPAPPALARPEREG